MNNDDFNALGKKIVNVFKTERLETYYIPPVSAKGLSQKNSGKARVKSQPSKGRISVKYKNIRQEKLKFSRPTTPDVNSAPSTSGGKIYPFIVVRQLQHVFKFITNFHYYVALDSEIRSSKIWLNMNVTPWESVQLHWEKTRDLRIADIKDPKHKIVGTIVENWPILKHPDAYTLIKTDLDALNATKFNGDKLVWENFFMDLKEIRPIRSNNKEVQELVKKLGEICETNDNTRVAIQIMLLSHMIPPVKKLAKKFKLTAQESVNSMLIHVKVQ